MDKIKNNGKKWIYWFTLGIAIIIAYNVMKNFEGITGIIGKFLEIITPFLAGAFIAYILYIPCKKIENKIKKSKRKIFRKKAKVISIIVVYVIAIALISLLIGVIIPIIIESVTDFLNNIQHYYEIAIQKYNEIPEDSVVKSEAIKDIIKSIQNLDIKQYFQLNKIMEYAITAMQAVTGIFKIFVTVIVSVYVLAERDQIFAFVKKAATAIFKEKTYTNFEKYMNNSNEIFVKFIASQFVDAIVVGILITIALSVMKVKYAPLLGFFIGLFNMIPYIGAIIATVIAVIITIITGGLSQAIWMLIVTIILQQIDANIINPKIIGQSLKISPLLVIFAVTIGGAYFGMLGMFLAVPVIAVIRIVVDDYLNLKIERKKQEEKLVNTEE